MTEDDPFGLSRFVEAQDLVFDTVLAELTAGRKETPWMWFVFPQLRAISRSPAANFHAGRHDQGLVGLTEIGLPPET